MGHVVETKEFWLCDRCGKKYRTQEDTYSHTELTAVQTVDPELPAVTTINWMCGPCTDDFNTFMTKKLDNTGGTA